jgi:membrane fusion protein, multidrug efflux system
MKRPWRTSGAMVPMLLVVMMAPTTGWSKGERSTQVTRSEHGVARGIVKAATQAVLYAQIQGRVSHVPYKEGQRFVKGAMLVQLDCDKYRAELAAAVAEHEAKDKTFQNNKELTKLNAVSCRHSDRRDQRTQLPCCRAIFRTRCWSHGERTRERLSER